MTKSFVQKRNNPLTENQALFTIPVIDCANTLTDSGAKIYLNSCFKQAIEYSELQKHASIETKPLIQFYSLLNLTKAYIIIKKNDQNITLDTLEGCPQTNSIFNSHGASSKGADEIKFGTGGTFIELAKVENFSSAKKDYFLNDLYKKIPDLKEYLKIFNNEDIDYQAVQYMKDYNVEKALVHE